MSTARIYVWAVLGLAVALTPTVPASAQPKDACPPSPPVVYRCHYDRIQPGMSESAVLAIIGYGGVEESASANARIVRWIDTPPYGPGVISIVFVRGKSAWIVSTKSGHGLRRRLTDAERAERDREQERHEAELKAIRDRTDARVRAIKDCTDIILTAIRERGYVAEQWKMKDDCMTERGFPPMKFDADGKPVK